MERRGSCSHNYSLLFDDEEKQLAETLRRSIAAPAERSESARQKDLTKLNDRGQTVHSFRTLLADLGTLAKNRVRVAGGQPCEFHMLTRPTEIQARTLSLLDVSLAP
jgi:hypothetical protein